MYTKQETSRNKQAFWTTFGQYMQPVSPADDVQVNWINYKTGVAGINFRMDADNTNAIIGIVLSHKDKEIQAAHYNQLLQLKTMLRRAMGEEWQWQPMITNEFGKVISRVSKTLSAINVNNTDNWPALISFFKPRIIALDAFWSDVKYGFDV